ncbi:MAG: hypothetical protein H7836_17590 [Magnetococcus sp. YQC-3]
MTSKSLFFLIALLLTLSFILFGCIDSGVPSIPFTTSQFVGKVTDLNYDKFIAGEYDGNFLVFDGNKLSIVDLNMVDINWATIINFPAGCLNYQAVKIVGSSLVCVDINAFMVDTNWQTSWVTLDANLKNYYALKGSDTNIWTNLFISDSNVFNFDLNTKGKLKTDQNFLCVDSNLCYNINDLNLYSPPASSTTYYPFNATAVAGTIPDNNIYLAKYYDDYNLQINEGNGANPLTTDINFSGVTNFSQIVMREYYLGSFSHYHYLWINFF